MAEVAADGRTRSGEQDEEEDVGVLRGEHDDHDVGDAGEGKRDEGGVDDGDEKESAESEVEEEGEEFVGMTARRSDGLRCGGDDRSESDGSGWHHRIC